MSLSWPATGAVRAFRRVATARRHGASVPQQHRPYMWKMFRSEETQSRGDGSSSTGSRAGVDALKTATAVGATPMPDTGANPGIAKDAKPSLSPNAQPTNDDVDISENIETMMERPPKLTFDHLSPTPSHLLDQLLYDLLPEIEPAFKLSHPPSTSRRCSPMPQGHHLVYSPLSMPSSQLAPDGADPDHCPGEPYVRRLWSGGQITFNHDTMLDGAEWLCAEKVQDVELKHGMNTSTVCVHLRRRYGTGHTYDDQRSWGIDEQRYLAFLPKAHTIQTFSRQSSHWSMARTPLPLQINLRETNRDLQKRPRRSSPQASRPLGHTSSTSQP